MTLLKKIKTIIFKKSSLHIGFKILLIDDILPLNNYKLIYNKNPFFLRLSNQPFQFADPFVFFNDRILYCFFEEKKKGEPGKIKVVYTADMINWAEQTCDLGVSSHLSFPFIIRHGENIFMLPESGALGEVALYRHKSFPDQWEKYRVLLKGNFVDSHIYYNNGYFYLFSTLKVPVMKSGHTFFDYELRLFYANAIDGPYLEHPYSPLHVGKKFGRSGGSILVHQGSIYRWSQDCSDRYGDDLHLFKIIEMTSSTFKEESVEDIWIRRYFKHKTGGHHISTYYFDDTLFAAVDFNYTDSYWQRFFDL